MSKRVSESLSAAVATLLRPLVRMLLRNGVPFRAFAELAKGVYVDVAHAEFAIPGRKQSRSRVSILTGLSRKEVQRIQETPPPRDDEALARYNRAARVISGWLRDDRFANGEWNPKPIPLEGGTESFAELVRLYGGDVPARAVLDELRRVGAVARRKDGRIELVHRAYVPRTGDAEKLSILGHDVADLIATIDHNLREDEGEPFFQRKVAYDNLPAEDVPALRRLTAGKSQALLEELDRAFSRHDRDVSRSGGGTGRKRVMLGVYYHEAEVTEEPAETETRARKQG